MIEEQAVITSKTDQQVTFEVERTAPCGICGQTRGCGNATWGKLLGHQQLSVKADNTINANVGDHVIVGLEEKVILNAAFYLYVVPLLGLFIGAIAANYFFVEELFVMLGAALGLLAGFAVVKRYLSRAGNAKAQDGKSDNQQSYAVVLRQANSQTAEQPSTDQPLPAQTSQDK